MVSVIIPVYNRAHYIKECLESVLSQTFNDLEIIVVDDGSTDNLKEVLSSFREKIRYVYKENGGAASARNEGMKHMRGEFIAWLDSDDRWLPFKLALEVEILRKLPHIGFVHSDFCCIDAKDKLVSASYIKQYFHILKQYKLDFDNMFSQSATLDGLGIRPLNDVSPLTRVYWGNISNHVVLGPMFLPSSMLLRRECIEKIGIFNEKYQTSEDAEFNARISKKFHAAYLDIPTLKYRRFHADQLSGSKMEIDSNATWLDIAIKLGKNDIPYYEKNKKLINLRIAHCYYGLGRAYFRNKRFCEAFKNFRMSIKMEHQQKRIYLYAILALVFLTAEFIKRVFKKNVIKLVKIIICTVFYYSRVIAVRRKKSKKSLFILAFHNINDQSFDPLSMGISVTLFEHLLKFLKKSYSIISLNQLLILIKEKRDIPSGSIILTFDDGYKDNYLNAFPLLKKYDIPATIFISVEAIHKQEALWYDRLVIAINSTQKNFLDLKKIGLGEYFLVSEKDKIKTIKEITETSKYMNKEKRDKTINAIIKELHVDKEDNSESRMLSWEEIKTMSKSGISFGSHGMSHSILTTLSKEEAEYEIKESKRIIKEKVGMDVNMYAYPNGSEKDFSDDVISLLKKYGYAAACTLMHGSNEDLQPFKLKRYNVTRGMITGLFGGFSHVLFETEISGIFDKLRTKK